MYDIIIHIVLDDIVLICLCLITLYRVLVITDACTVYQADGNEINPDHPLVTSRKNVINYIHKRAHFIMHLRADCD